MKTLDVLPTAFDIPNDGWESTGEVGKSLGWGLGCGGNFDGAVDEMNGVSVSGKIVGTYVHVPRFWCM